MKAKIVLFVGFLMFLSFTAISQPSAGGLFVGGSFSFTSESSSYTEANRTEDGPTVVNFSLMPVAGFFVAENIAIGSGIGFSSRKETTPRESDDIEETRSMFHLKPFVKYYLGSDAIGMYAQAELEAAFGGSSTKVGNRTTDGPDIFNLNIGVRPGFYYFVTPRLCLEANMGFFGLRRSEATETEGNDEFKDVRSFFGLSFSPSTLSFGLVFHL